MKCEECLSVIEEYYDDELDERGARNISAHLSACFECASVYEELGREQEVYARYQRDVEVTPALWAAVESKIKQEKLPASPGMVTRLADWLRRGLAAPRLSPALAVALVVIAVGVTVAVMSYIQSRDNGATNIATVEPGSGEQAKPSQTPHGTGGTEQAAANQGGQPGAETGPEVKPDVKREESVRRVEKAPLKSAPQKTVVARHGQSPEQLVREAEQKYLAAIAILSRDVNRRKSKLEPDVLARFESALASIDTTIAETRRAVRDNPGDPIALNYMLAAYAKKVEALREMARD
jgi:hypothetical protein